ncbi:hypothetical protein MTR_6g017300 [Medicago truncatula]|uniref:Uncharacterized protein n=1 Tax=Medicago truncatula TaxID=3880 RepID=A0A072UHS0_MEDTR|nr:hypothetical protein MTR_6g017300 [Medicago truncatula]
MGESRKTKSSRSTTACLIREFNFCCRCKNLYHTLDGITYMSVKWGCLHETVADLQSTHEYQAHARPISAQPRNSKNCGSVM